MGYESALHLIDVKIKSASMSEVERALKAPKRRNLARISDFLERAVLDSDGFLAFKATGDGHDPYEPDDRGTVPALFGKWYEDDRIANWLRKHCERGGRIILHSIEADGEAWGWEFDGKGKMRALALRHVGKWT